MVPDDEKVSGSQMILLLITTVTATGFLFVPAITAQYAAQDGWMSVLFVATLFGFMVAFVCVKLGTYFPDQTVVEFAPRLAGRVIGKLIGLIYVFWFTQSNANIVQEFGSLLSGAFMHETPILVFNLVAVVLGAMAVRHGMEVLARMNQFIFPLFLAVVATVVTLVIPEMDLSRIRPVFEHGIKPVLDGALTPNGWRGEVMIILMFMPYLNRPGEIGKTVYSAVILIGLLLTAPTLAGLLVFGPEVVSHTVFPTLKLAQYISLGMFIERIEAIVVVVWVMALTAKIGAFYLASVLAVAQTLGVKDYRPLVIPVGIITLVLSTSQFENSGQVSEWLAITFVPFSYTVELLIPLLLFLVALVLKKVGRLR